MNESIYTIIIFCLNKQIVQIMVITFSTSRSLYNQAWKNIYFPAIWAKFPLRMADFHINVFLYCFPLNYENCWEGASFFQVFSLCYIITLVSTTFSYMAPVLEVVTEINWLWVYGRHHRYWQCIQPVLPACPIRKSFWNTERSKMVSMNVLSKIKTKEMKME